MASDRDIDNDASLVPRDPSRIALSAGSEKMTGAGGPDMERLVEGRERIYLDRFWNEFAGTSSVADTG